MKNIITSLIFIFGIILSIILFKKVPLLIGILLIIIIGVSIPILQKFIIKYIHN